jgi:hypothetical protein
MATPADRQRIARQAANTRWSKVEDRTAAMSTAINNSPASIEYWMAKVDPNNKMPRKQRLARATNAKKAFYDATLAKARAAKAAKAASGSAS